MSLFVLQYLNGSRKSHNLQCALAIGYQLELHDMYIQEMQYKK